MEEKERLEKLEPAEALADRGRENGDHRGGKRKEEAGEKLASIWTASCRWRP